MREDYRVAEMKHSQHEFLKMSQVGSLINEASQQLMDKLMQKEKITRENKQQIRQVDTKLKQLEQNVSALMKLTGQVNDVYKRQKDMKIEYDQEVMGLKEDLTQYHVKMAELENQIKLIHLKEYQAQEDKLKQMDEQQQLECRLRALNDQLALRMEQLHLEGKLVAEQHKGEI